jgi:hypothetical protein
MQPIQPHHTRLEGDRINRITGKAIEWTFLGEAAEHVLLVNDTKLKVISTPPMFEVPEHLVVEFDPSDVVVLPN